VYALPFPLHAMVLFAAVNEGPAPTVKLAMAAEE
jgi:hypothetical protein